MTDFYKYGDKHARRLNQNSLSDKTKKFNIRKKYFPKGCVVYVDLGKGLDSEQSGVRPCVVIQNNTGNKHSGTTIVAPVSKKLKGRIENKEDTMPTHFIIDNYRECGLNEHSVVLCEQMKVISKRRIRSHKPMGFVDVEKLNKCLCVSLGIENLA